MVPYPLNVELEWRTLFKLIPDKYFYRAKSIFLYFLQILINILKYHKEHILYPLENFVGPRNLSECLHLAGILEIESYRFF